MIIVRTPFRISFFGGGTDYVEWYSKYPGGFITSSCQWGTTIAGTPRVMGGYTLSMINNTWQGDSFESCPMIYIKTIFTRYPIPPMNIMVTADLPTGSGLGSSGSLVVSLLAFAHTVRHEYFTKQQLAAEAYYIEHDILKETVGIQDQLSVAYGSLLYVAMDKGHIQQLQILPSAQLDQYLCMIYTGKQRNSSNVSSVNLNKMFDRTEYYEKIYHCIEPAKKAILNEDYQELGRLLDYTWQLKQNISDHMGSTEITEIYKQGMAYGAMGGKLMGAGGGGFVLFFAPKTTQDKLQAIYGDYFIPLRLMNTGCVVQQL